MTSAESKCGGCGKPCNYMLTVPVCEGSPACEAKIRGEAPIPMILTCPACGSRHYDEGDFATKPHHTHACQSCGMCWRPAVVATVGVQFLPGFRNAFGEVTAHVRRCSLHHLYGPNPSCMACQELNDGQRPPRAKEPT